MTSKYVILNNMRSIWSRLLFWALFDDMGGAVGGAVMWCVMKCYAMFELHTAFLWSRVAILNLTLVMWWENENYVLIRNKKKKNSVTQIILIVDWRQLPLSLAGCSCNWNDRKLKMKERRTFYDLGVAGFWWLTWHDRTGWNQIGLKSLFTMVNRKQLAMHGTIYDMGHVTWEFLRVGWLGSRPSHWFC